jgi:hypothetical protein
MSGDLLPVSLDEMIFEMWRELQLRQHLYPLRVAERKMNARRAERQLRIVEAIIEKLTAERAATVAIPPTQAP